MAFSSKERSSGLAFRSINGVIVPIKVSRTGAALAFGALAVLGAVVAARAGLTRTLVKTPGTTVLQRTGLNIAPGRRPFQPVTTISAITKGAKGKSVESAFIILRRERRKTRFAIDILGSTEPKSAGLVLREAGRFVKSRGGRTIAADLTTREIVRTLAKRKTKFFIAEPQFTTGVRGFLGGGFKIKQPITAATAKRFVGKTAAETRRLAQRVATRKSRARKQTGLKRLREIARAAKLNREEGLNVSSFVFSTTRIPKKVPSKQKFVGERVRKTKIAAGGLTSLVGAAALAEL